MTTDDAARFAGALARLSEHYQRDMSESGAYDYFEALRPLPIEAVEAVIPDLIREGQYMPRGHEWFESARAWALTERARIAEARATTHGLPESGTYTPAEAETVRQAEMARVRRLLAEPLPETLQPRRWHTDRRGPESVGDVLGRMGDGTGAPGIGRATPGPAGPRLVTPGPRPEPATGQDGARGARGDVEASR